MATASRSTPSTPPTPSSPPSPPPPPPPPLPRTTPLTSLSTRSIAPPPSSILPVSFVLLVAFLLSAADSVVPAPLPRPLSVVDSFLVPRFRYDPICNVFYQHAAGLPLHGEAGDKANLYRDRFQLLLQRLRRGEFFLRSMLFDAEMTEAESSELTPIQSLIGCTRRKWIMGMIL